MDVFSLLPCFPCDISLLFWFFSFSFHTSMFRSRWRRPSLGRSRPHATPFLRPSGRTKCRIIAGHTGRTGPIVFSFYLFFYVYLPRFLFLFLDIPCMYENRGSFDVACANVVWGYRSGQKASPCRGWLAYATHCRFCCLPHERKRMVWFTFQNNIAIFFITFYFGMLLCCLIWLSNLCVQHHNEIMWAAC